MGTLRDVILRVAQLAEDFPEVAELDHHRVIVSPSGAVAVDLKVRLTPFAPGLGPPLRRLR